MAVGRRERGVEELYNATEVIGEPKITSVLRGSFRMQGPVEETEEDIEKNMLPSQSEKRLGKRSMRRKVRTRVESGTCNVCSTPCSSCMHLKLACMGSKGNGFSDETFHETATSQNSINEDDLFPFKNRAYDSLQHTTSEASNLLSVNSSHDSLSENVESKASINCTDMVDASVESEMLPKLSFGGTVVVDQLFPKPQSILDQITPSNKNEYPKVLEGHDDNISCVSRANDASITVIHHNRNVDRKNLSCSSALVGSLGSEGTEKAPISPESELLETPSNDAYAGNSSLNVQSRCLSTSNGTQLEEDRKLGTSMVSSQLAEGTGKALILPKSELLGTPSNDAYAGSSSQKVQSRCLSSTADGRDFEEDTKFDSSKVSSQLLEGTGKALIFPKAELLEIPSNDVYAGSSSLKVQSRCLSSTTNGTQLEEDTKFDTSKVSSKVCTKVEEGTKKDRGDRMNEGFKCANQVEANEKSNESVELTDMREPGLQSVSGDESDESEIEEHDVKVCDICGDAGREDLLAICSKCSDGAEHTYCMREMLQKVPEGDWLCEECKLAEETENQKQGSDSEGKRMNKASAHSSGKRHVETMEVASASKRQAIETTFGSPKSSSPSRPAALLRDSSFKGLDKGKVNPAQQTSFVNHSSIDTPETARSSIVPRIQTPKGTLLKSNSFNTFSKSKVKLVDEVPQKQKGSRENRSLDIKEGTARMISKSMSFRSVSSVRSNATDSKVKMLSSKFSQAQDIKALKQVKEQSAFESKSSSKLGRPMGVSVTNSSNISVPKVSQKLTPRGDSVMVSTTSNNKESNASQSDGKLGSLSRSTSSIARKGAEIPVTSVRSLPANGISSAFVEQKLNQVSPKDEPSSSSSGTAERPYHNMDENLQDGLSRSRESSNQSEKTRESSVSRSRPAITAGPKNITCQKCKEIGHATDCCTVVSPRASVVDTSAARTVREDMSKGSKLKAAIEAAMLKKPGIFKKKKESDQSDGLSSLNVDVTFEIAPHDQFSVSNKMRNMISDEGTEEGQANIGICSSENYKEANINNEKQLNVHSTDAVSPFKAMVLDSTIPSLGKPIHALGATPLFSKMLIIPQHEYIWQGAFEVCRGGKLLNLYGGIQAHLSTCASPKVLEVANQFPQKITMDEVPRLSMWPRQFHDNGSKEDNIALYFFAKDLESYEKSYKNLLDNMIKRDLALKGYFDGVEFLIFPSTQLPENSQRWNTLFFLWGVFRGNRSSCSDSFNKLVIPGSNVVPWDMNSPDKPLTSLNGDLDNKASQTNSEEQDGRLDSNSLSTNAASSAFFCSETRCTSPSKEAATLPECRVDTEHKPSTQATGISTGSKSREETQSHVDASCVRENSSSFKVFQVGDKGEDVRESVVEEKMVDRMDTHRDEVKVERNLNENSLMMDAEASSGRDLNKGLDWQSNSRKRSYLDLSETAPRTSSSTGQKMPWDIVDGESIKKLKTGFCELYGCSSAREGNSLSDGFASQICDLGSSSSIEERSCDKAADEKVILEDIGTTERYFFPVDSRRVKDFRLGDNSMPWKEYSSNDEDEFHDEVPNLELALGAEAKTPNKGILPFFVGMVEKNNSQKKTPDNVTDKEEEDGVSASLSLSLSFPFPDEEQTVKPVSKTEQLLPERHNVNTSLLLFGGFSDK